MQTLPKPFSRAFAAFYLAALALAGIVGLTAPQESRAAALTNTFENTAGGIFKGTNITAPKPLAVGLATACDETGVTELANSGGYARVALSPSTAWSGPTGGNATITNASAVTFPKATADWNGGAIIGYWFLADSAVNGGGSILLCANLTTPRTVTAGATLTFSVAAISIARDN